MDKPTFLKIGKGAKIKNLQMDDNTIIGDANFIDNEGEIKNASLNRNRQFIPNRLKPLVAAIKKPSANSGKGWKIIVGFIFVSIAGPITVNIATELWKEHRATTTQEQPQIAPSKSTANNLKK